MKLTESYSDIKSAVAGPGGTGGPSAEDGRAGIGHVFGQVPAKAVAMLILIQTSVGSRVESTTAAFGDRISTTISSALHLVDGARDRLRAHATGVKAKVSAKADSVWMTVVARVPAPVKALVAEASELSKAALSRATEAIEQSRAAAAACIGDCRARAAKAATKAQAVALWCVPARVKSATKSTLAYAAAEVALWRSVLSSAADNAGTQTHKSIELAKDKASALGAGARAVALDPKYQVTAASAVGGAAALGASGGAAAAVVGGVAGAACGIPPALLTFGLSIPLGAMAGSSLGLIVGTTAGGFAGLLSGGAVGFAGYTKRGAISGGASSAWSKVSGCIEEVHAKATASTAYVKGKAGASTKYVKDTAFASREYVRARLVGGTGGTDAA